MSNIDDETVRAKMRKLRVSTFADIFNEIVNDEAYTDALPEDIFLAAVEEAYTQRQQRNIAKAIAQAKFRYPDASLEESAGYGGTITVEDHRYDCLCCATKR